MLLSWKTKKPKKNNEKEEQEDNYSDTEQS